jgi:MoaA/NifB/PqqE/SkfB family radical SAM enzyme
MQFTETQPTAVRGLGFLWLEITGRCNLTCSHCYADSRPSNPLIDRMATADWTRVLDQAAELGCRAVQFIGGEPTLHPSICDLIRHAYSNNFEMIEVFTNATGLRPEFIECVHKCEAQIATSFYSDDGAVHDRITTRSGSFLQTVRGIKSVIDAGIPIRVGLIEMVDNNGHTDRAKSFLSTLGVKNIGLDHARRIGRANASVELDPINELCGACWMGKLCVTPSGDTYPCIMARCQSVGSVLTHSVAEIISGTQLAAMRQRIHDEVWLPRNATHGDTSEVTAGCNPPCNPDCQPRTDCKPIFWCRPDRTCLPD